MYQGVTPSPDPLFLRDLREFDPKLHVEFDRAVERFVITKPVPFGRPWVVLVVEGEDGGYRPPDKRDIAKLWFGDLWRHGGVEENIRRGENRLKEAHEKSDATAEAEIRDHTKDEARYLRKQWRQLANDGKANSDIRRIDTKQKGCTVEEIQTLRKHGIDPWSREERHASI